MSRADIILGETTRLGVVSRQKITERKRSLKPGLKDLEVRYES